MRLRITSIFAMNVKKKPYLLVSVRVHAPFEMRFVRASVANAPARAGEIAAIQLGFADCGIGRVGIIAAPAARGGPVMVGVQRLLDVVRMRAHAVPRGRSFVESLPKSAFEALRHSRQR